MYPRSAISLLPSFQCYNVHFTLEGLGLREGDCVEVTATTDMIQNQMGVEEDGEVVVCLSTKDYWSNAYYSNELAWVTVARIHVGTGEGVR